MDLFLEKLSEYKNKCDSFIRDGSLSGFLSGFGLDEVMGGYIDALIRHSGGGKRIRAYLVALGYGLFKGFDNIDEILAPSISYELFQTGILAHDDIIDNSDYRRFGPSMHKDLGVGHDGISKSICVGDFGIVSAIEIIGKSGFSPEIKLRAVSHQNRVFSATIAGELKDIEFSYADKVSEKDILEMYRLKTAQYTVSGPLVLGAILGGASEDEISLLSQFGDAVGVSFQIRDDILGLFGDEDKLGKSNLSDMNEGKKTVLVSHFEENASDTEKIEFYSVYGKENGGEEQLRLVRRLLTEAGSLDYAKALCLSYTEKALAIIKSISLSEEGEILLTGLLDYMTSRTN